MELQWPLILFTTLLAASAGLFATQGVYVLAGKGEKAQMPALITSAVLLVVGGIAVFLHLEHWERIFNGFGHITSGITQELIAVVVMAVVMAAYFVMLRKGAVPKWCAIAAIVIAAVLVLVMGLSYMMDAHPTWNTLMQICSLYGIALAAGPGIFALIDATQGEAEPFTGLVALVGTIVNAVCALSFVSAMAGAAGQMVDVGNYFDPNHPTYPMMSSDLYSPFADGTMPMTIGAIVLALAAVAFALYGRFGKKWLVAGAGVAACAVIGGVLLRAVFFATGGSVFMFY